jgi:hypothetical protein
MIDNFSLRKTNTKFNVHAITYKITQNTRETFRVTS